MHIFYTSSTLPHAPENETKDREWSELRCSIIATHRHVVTGMGRTRIHRYITLCRVHRRTRGWRGGESCRVGGVL